MSHDLESLPTMHDQQVGRLQAAVANASHVTLEFGTGTQPLFESQFMTTFDGENLYVGANIDSLQHKRLAEKVESIGGFAILSELNDGVIEPLPLPSKSVDTILLANVFGEPNSQNIMQAFSHVDGKYAGNSSIDSKLQTLREAKRLLKPGGELVVLETNTPYGIRESIGKGYYHHMVSQLQAAGYEIQTAVDRRHNPNEWLPTATTYAAQSDWWSDHSYLVIATNPLET